MGHTRHSGRRPLQTKREFAIEALRDAILRGHYPPGERLRQNRIAAELGLSATPVREALRELSAQGLLLHESRRSVRVATIDLANLRELYAVRTLLESEAARRSVPRFDDADVARLAKLQLSIEEALETGAIKAIGTRDNEFHLLLYSKAANRHLERLIEQLWRNFPRHVLWYVPGRPEQSIEEHRRIVEAARRRDGPGAARAVAAHLKRSFKGLSNYVEVHGLRVPRERSPARRNAAA